MPTATVVSLDARAGRQPRLPQWLVTTAGVGLILSLAWIYLSTAAVKTGSAWWQEGSAVWLVLLDRGTPTAPGRWLAGTAPSGIWPTISHMTLLIECAAPLLILWPRSRGFAVLSLVLFHLAMWPLLALESFPLVMIAAVTIRSGLTTALVGHVRRPVSVRWLGDPAGLPQHPAGATQR